MRRYTAKNIVLSVAILLLLAVAVICAVHLFQPAVLPDRNVTSTKTIERNGVKYFPRQDITTFLIMGIDKEGKVESGDSYNNDGEADVVVVVVVDETNECYDILCLNRDTMVDIPVLGVGGRPAGTVNAQLALSHTYGSGLKDSCENTEKTVSDFLYGIDIDYYVAFNMDAIGILNDAVGGVTVNVSDDFSAIDPSIQKGSVILNASQAVNFVRTRKGLGDQMNLSRMERHKEYMNGFFRALGSKLNESTGFAIDAFNQVSDYMVTDCSAETLANFANRYADYTVDEIVSPDGENVRGDEFMEFYPDKDKLDSLILRLFYAEK